MVFLPAALVIRSAPLADGSEEKQSPWMPGGQISGAGQTECVCGFD